ncbi:flagellar assembly protein FliH [Thiohalospira halophila DSM 15071]|uniref:Flagellar assembly protein FliH n=1 Tax=Thiohalospira halophila DSM 15071 TaxID=1123397 RepID=A0A1I1PGC7_9GAMM|nr:flagellar assembly protein FliH [Thiohalospira halophila]SFD08864.1 flagellar assembly protein FliH [Thiohalospira halophila DSM 15071]
MSSVIPAAEAEAVSRWYAPDMDDPEGRRQKEAEAAAEAEEAAEEEPEADPWPTEEELAAIREEARTQGYNAGYEAGHAAGEEAGTAAGKEAGHQEGHAAGYEAGLAEGREAAEAERQQYADAAAQLEAITAAFARPLEQLDESVEEQLLAVVNAAARQLVRRELRHHPDEVVAVVREALAELPSQAQAYELHLHPEDASLVREALGVREDDAERQWELVEDPGLTRGGCRVESEYTRVDATLERRLAALSARLLGGERGDDDQHADG